MKIPHLLAAVLVVCAAPAFAQNQTTPLVQPGDLASKAETLPDFSTPIATPSQTTASEPWRIIPNSAPELDSAGGLPISLQLDRSKALAQLARAERELVLRSNEDITCYKIRSYLVARDNKDSDSTHPVGYSTCQASSRYGLKTTEIRQYSSDK